MRCLPRRPLTPCCLAIATVTLLLGCSHDKKHPAAVERPESPFIFNPAQAQFEQQLKTSNAEIIEQLLTAYRQGSDPSAGVDQQRQAELALHAAMVKLEFWYTHGGRDYLLQNRGQTD